MENTQKEALPTTKKTTEKDSFGFRKGTACSMIANYVAENKYTKKEIDAKMKGNTKISTSRLLGVLKKKGFKVVFNNKIIGLNNE